MSTRPFSWTAALALLAAVSLGGCGAIMSQAQMSRHTGSAAIPSSVLVVAGDTVYELARRYRVSVRALIDYNGLRAPYHLYTGQTIYLPPVGDHVVVAGDTVWGIAHQHGVPMRELIRANGLKPPYVIRVGQRLRLPGLTPAQEAAGVRVAAASPAADGPPRAKPERAADSAPVQKVALTRPAPRPPMAVPPPPPLAGGFAWPASGTIVARFGPAGKGLHNDGINIALPHGAPIHAAGDGVVAYAGNELRGFGNLLLIKHDGGWMTAYAHNSELLVARGAVVRRGQQIARAGATGNVAAPQLHFELRKGSRAVDPLEHLPRMQAGLPQASLR